MDLEPFELHPGSPSMIRAAGEDMTAIARTMIDQESLLVSRFSFLPAYWQGVAADELRDAPEPVEIRYSKCPAARPMSSVAVAWSWTTRRGVRSVVSRTGEVSTILGAASARGSSTSTRS